MSARFFFLAAAIVAGIGAVAAQATRPYTDPVKGFVTQVPEGWSDFAGGVTTYSPDKSVSCTISVTPNPRTVGVAQSEINQSLQVYTADLWRAQFFQGGATGLIEQAGVTQLDGYDAPWAKGQITYPGRALAKFTILMVQGPGKIVSGTCTGEPSGYDKTSNLYGVGKILNYLRPA